jgi:hypothetical protein
LLIDFLLEIQRVKMEYSIEDFWLQLFSGVSRQAEAKALQGWAFNINREPSFVQANLSLREGFNDLTQKVWLVGAPGAVGKSTLAREICASTGAVYLDLADSATVAGNYIVGGLVYTNLLDAWKAGKVAVIVDALDEARLRVTQSGFEAFLTDIANAASIGKFPIVVLGRIGIVEEAWTILNELIGINPPIFDIELFNETQANQFVWARLQTLHAATDTAKNLLYPGLKNALEIHRPVYEGVISRFIKGLKDLSAQDGDRFVGYAPVLDAVSKVIASETNPAKIGEEMQRILNGQVFTSLSNEILNREQSKLVAQLQNSFPDLPEGLYGPKEQLNRLGARIFGANHPSLPSQLKQDQVASYEEALNNLLPQHPFLDGSGASPSSAVFAASVIAAALRSGGEELRKSAERYVNSALHTSNPFLYEFYGEQASIDGLLTTEHVGLVYESVLARAKPGEVVRLSIEGDDDAKNLDVEILIDRGGESRTRLEFKSPSKGILKFGRRVSGVHVDAENTSVELGAGDQLELVAPVFIAAQNISLLCKQVVAKSESQSAPAQDALSRQFVESTVILESEVLVADAGLPAPIVRTGVQLQVSWPNASSYPWTQFSGPSTAEEDPKTADALRALRRIALAFRSHSKGQLARYKGKIDHQRMMKGQIGSDLLAKLIRDKVISLKGPMYLLDADALGEVVGASYVNLKLKLYSDKSRQYVQG